MKPTALAILLISLSSLSLRPSDALPQEERDILVYTIAPSTANLAMYYLDRDGEGYRSFNNLKSDLSDQGRELRFAMNGGMYMEDRRPLGLYVEQKEVIRPLSLRQEGHGNFYLQPNGVFALYDDGHAEICPSTEFEVEPSLDYATQSGPMLLIDGELHPGLTPGSSNVHIRNGVGVKPNGELVFAMSQTLINFYDFASFFKNSGCQYALYLDGFVSRTYCPEQGAQFLGGNFGVIIAETN